MFDDSTQKLITLPLPLSPDSCTGIIFVTTDSGVNKYRLQIHLDLNGRKIICFLKFHYYDHYVCRFVIHTADCSPENTIRTFVPFTRQKRMLSCTESILWRRWKRSRRGRILVCFDSSYAMWTLGFRISYHVFWTGSPCTTEIIRFIYYTTPVRCTTKHTRARSHTHTHTHTHLLVYYFKWLP